MSKTTTLFTIVGILVLAGAACVNDDAEPVLGIEPATTRPPHVEIQGPDVIRRSGEYRWWAIAFGTDREVEYEWEMSELGHAGNTTYRHGHVLDLFLEASEPTRYEVRVLARAGEHVVHASTIVAICPFTPPLDDCLERLGPGVDAESR